MRKAKRTAQIDWLGRIELLTEGSPLGEVPIGKIVVVDKRQNKVFTDIYATRKVCLQVPLFFFYGLLLYIPVIQKIMGNENQGCNGDACEV